ncbi:MAG: hypothetical protein H0T50_08160 [Gemmatimonadales bacterium]|nr:hypothetical protein [Gemmatimonadales bacterium]MBA3555805.1 hypothetical protein [Gemmatimonadales bacterium]
MTQFFVTLAAGLVGYLLARRFVSRRLRFVDAVQSRFAPLVAALTATLMSWPLTLLPAITLTTAMVFGIGTGLGTASGARLVRRADVALKRITP